MAATPHAARSVVVVRRGDDHGIDLLFSLREHLAVVVVSRHLGHLLQRLDGPLIVYIADGHDVLADARDRVGEPTPAPTDPD